MTSPDTYWFWISTTSFFFHVADTLGTLDGNTISGNAVGIFVDEDAADLTKSVTLTGAGNFIQSNATGVEVDVTADSGLINLDGNRFFGDSTGEAFVNNGGGLTSAECSWWGDVSGPKAATPPNAGNPATRCRA